jgi:adenylate cyclase
MKTNKKAPKQGFWASKKVQKFLELIHSPSAIGLYVSIAIVISAYQFYEVRDLNETQRESNQVFDAIEWIDLKTMDARFRFREEIPPEAPLALLTIDDRSIEEVGRWPWSREKTAEVIQKMMDFGAKAIGFDIVFSEPQIDSALASLQRIEAQAHPLPANLQSLFASEKKMSQPDQVLSNVFTKYADRLILGAFNEESRRNFRPYQDYCRNAAFKRANSEKFVKITNVSFIVDDVADPFVDLNFDSVFDQIFPYLEKTNAEAMLKKTFHRDRAEDLNSLEQKRLKYSLEEENFNYCNRWLTNTDDFLKPSEGIYLKVFEKSDILKGLSFEEAVKKLKSAVKAHPVVQHSRWTINTDELQENINYTGSFNAEQDADGTIRKASMFFRTGNKTGLSFIPSLALQTYLVATGYRADVEINIDPKNPQQKIISKFIIKDSSQDPEVEIGSIPVDKQGRMRINYAGGTNMYAFLPAKELFSDNSEVEITQSKYDPDTKTWMPMRLKVNKAEFIKGRTFIFGATAIGVYDLRVTPFEKNFPGPETHLNALGNLFQRNFIRTSEHEEKIMLATLAILGILLSFGLAQAGAVLGFVITLLSGVIIFALDRFLFLKGIVATMALPAILVLSLYLILTFYKYFTEERKKKHLRSTFSKYVSPAIVDEILKDPENIELGGKKQRMSVFFSDVRGFTTISEKLDPQELSDVLNKYLTPMTEIVFANKGTLDKYMGDAVMAFFGAPIYYPDHAKYACRCALQSIEKLKEIQIQFKEQGLPNIDIGIGVNSGEMSVGNMGSETVRSYTVMGDAVNLGSRLEGINKEYGTRIIISEFIYEEVKNDFTAREIDWVRVKGKYKPVRIYELISEGAPPTGKKIQLEHFGNGFVLYHEKKFAEAKDFFQQALAANPEDPVSKLYIERCDDYLQTPPPEEWDGVFVMKTK